MCLFIIRPFCFILKTCNLKIIYVHVCPKLDPPLVCVRYYLKQVESKRRKWNFSRPTLFTFCAMSYLNFYTCTSLGFNFKYMYGNITNRSIHPIRPSLLHHVTGSANTRARAGYGSSRCQKECGISRSVNVLSRDYEI